MFMEKLVINTNSPEEENILKIIEYVKQIERGKGLSEEKIEYKYTHGDCTCLAFLIKTILPNVKVKWVGSCIEDGHCCIAIKGDPETDPRLEDYIDEDLYYFDINGKKYYEEMKKYLSETFNTNYDRINARYKGSNVGASQNEVTAEVLKNVTIINNKDKEDNRKIYSIEKFIELITSTREKIMLPLVLAGHNRMELNGKNEEELRQMVLNYITVNQKDFFNALSSGNSKLVLDLQKATILIGLSTEELYARLGFDIVMEHKRTAIPNENDNYLYQTEKLIEMAKQEFIESQLSNSERVLTYISKIQEIEKKFRYYAVHEVGFVGSERYKIVYEYLKDLPRVVPFTPDESKGNGINMINSKRYYDNLAAMIEESFSQSNTQKKY